MVVWFMGLIVLVCGCSWFVCLLLLGCMGLGLGMLCVCLVVLWLWGGGRGVVVLLVGACWMVVVLCVDRLRLTYLARLWNTSNVENWALQNCVCVW